MNVILHWINSKRVPTQLSLEPIELKQLITRIRSIETQLPDWIDHDNDGTIFRLLTPILGQSELNDVKMALAPVKCKQIQNCEMECRFKFGKSLVYHSNLKSGTTLSEYAICAKVSEPFGTSAEHFDKFIGKILIKKINQDENLTIEHFEKQMHHESNKKIQPLLI